MKTNDIVLLGLIGVAIFYLYKQNQKKVSKTNYTTAPNPVDALPHGIVPYNDLGLPDKINTNTGQAIEQTLDVSGKPVETAYTVRYAIKGIPNII